MSSETPLAVFTFYTTADAMAAERVCARRGLPGRLMPVPRALSADCGIAWGAPATDGVRVAAALEEAGVETAGAHLWEGRG